MLLSEIRGRIIYMLRFYVDYQKEIIHLSTNHLIGYHQSIPNTPPDISYTYNQLLLTYIYRTPISHLSAISTSSKYERVSHTKKKSLSTPMLGCRKQSEQSISGLDGRGHNRAAGPAAIAAAEHQESIGPDERGDDPRHDCRYYRRCWRRLLPSSAAPRPGQVPAELSDRSRARLQHPRQEPRATLSGRPSAQAEGEC